MNITVVADYFQVSKLLDLAGKMRDCYAFHLALDLCRREPDPKLPAGSTIKMQVLAAIGILIDSSSDYAEFRVKHFGSTLLRLILCCAHCFDIKELCNTHPTFLEFCKAAGTEENFQLQAIAEQDSHARMQACVGSPNLRQCMKCQDAGLKHSFVDTMASVLLQTIKVRCNKCFVVPSLEEWKIAAKIEKLTAEEDEMEDCFQEEKEFRSRQILEARENLKNEENEKNAMDSRIKVEREDMSRRLEKARLDLERSRGC